MRHLIVISFLTLALAGCSPSTKEYCERKAASGSQAYADCLSTADQQSTRFDADRTACGTAADAANPPIPYDIVGSSNDDFAVPDYTYDAKMQRKRTSTVRSCMRQKGWRSEKSWMDGRR